MAIAAPMPRDAPVTSAMWPFKSGLMVMIEVLVGRAVGCQSSGISEWRPLGDGGTDEGTGNEKRDCHWRKRQSGAGAWPILYAAFNRKGAPRAWLRAATYLANVNRWRELYRLRLSVPAWAALLPRRP